MATKEFNPLEYGAVPVKEFDPLAYGAVPVQAPTQEVPKSFGDKLLGAGTAVSNFLGGRGVTDYLGAKIAKAAVPKEQRQFISEPTGKDVAGSALQLGSLFLPFGTIARGVGLGLKGIGAGQKLSRFGGALGAGATGGYAVDVGANLQEDRESPFTPGIGTAIGTGIPTIGPALRLGRRMVGEASGTLTGAGYGAIKEGFEAARAGGSRAGGFTNALRGGQTAEKIVTDSKNALDNVVTARRTNYEKQFSKLQGATKRYSHAPVIEKFNEMLAKFDVEKLPDGTPDFSRSPGLARYEPDFRRMSSVLENWGSKAGDNTVLGMDKLKQILRDFRIGSQDSKKFDAFVTALSNTAQDTVINHPGYKKLVTDYGESTDLIKEISRGLSLGDKHMTDTAFRKLTSILRTNNEFRRELLRELETHDPTIGAKIAGQQLSEIAPRGLMRQLTTFGAAVAMPAILKALIFTSPRVTGEFINAMGFTARQLDKVKNIIGPTQFPGDILAQGGARAAQRFGQKVSETPGKQGGFIGGNGAQIFSKAKGLSASDIMAKHPDINLKRDVTVTDIHGKKSVIPEGEALTPYELKGNKVLLQDGETYIVSKNQYANVKGNAVSGEAKEFAPELQGLEETVKGAEKGMEPFYREMEKKYGTGITMAKVSPADNARWKTLMAGKDNTKFSSYTLPDGENYREILVKAPSTYKNVTELPAGSEFVKRGNGYYVRTPETGEQFIGSGSTKQFAKEDALKALNDHVRKGSTDFKSSHWDEPNVLTHIRLNDRTYKGKKVAFMEELQSDWAREGRSKGFATPENQAKIARKEELRTTLDKMQDDARKVYEKKIEDIDNKMYDLRELAAKPYQEKYDYYSGIAGRRSLTPAEEKAYNKYEDLMINPWDKIVLKDKKIYPKIQALEAEKNAQYREMGDLQTKLRATEKFKTMQDELDSIRQVENGVPNHPSLKNWQTLAIKRALKDAVDSGAEYFAWINGEQTSARYNLATHVEDVGWRNLAGKKHIKLKPKSGVEIFFDVNAKGEIQRGVAQGVPDEWFGKKLDEVLGKGLADKIMEKESGTLSGEGLKFGGEWANNLYDKQVKNIAEDVTGGRVIDIDLGLPVEKPFKQNWLFEDRTGVIPVTRETIKVGDRVSNYTRNEFVVTEVLDGGKFKAIPMSTLSNYLDGQTPQQYLDMKAFDKRLVQKNGEGQRSWIDAQIKNRKKFLDNSSAEFNLAESNPKTTTQQGILLTPEIKARIRGDAPTLKKPSGKRIFKSTNIQEGR